MATGPHRPGLGGFLVGVLLAKSKYRTSMEASIEPFKGPLLGLFFLSIGMSAVNLDASSANIGGSSSSA